MAARKRSTAVKRVSARKAFAVKRPSSRNKSGRKSGRIGRETAAGVVIPDRPIVLAGIAREALSVFKGGVRVALQGLSRRDVAVMIKTPEGPVVGVPVMKNGVFVGLRTNDTPTNKSGSRGPKR